MTVDFQQILTAAQQLPKLSQAQLVSALLHEQGSVHTPALEPLNGLTTAELRTLAASVLAPAQARRLKQLLRLQRKKKILSCLASRTGRVTRRKRPRSPRQSESRLHPETAQDVRHGSGDNPATSLLESNWGAVRRVRKRRRVGHAPPNKTDLVGNAVWLPPHFYLMRYSQRSPSGGKTPNEYFQLRSEPQQGRVRWRALLLYSVAGCCT